MSKINEIKSLLGKVRVQLSELVQKLGRAELVDGTIVEWEGELVQGSDVWVVTEEGGMPAPDGTHVTNEGVEITTEGGSVTAIVQAEEEVEEAVEQEEEVAELEVEEHLEESDESESESNDEDEEESEEEEEVELEESEDVVSQRFSELNERLDNLTSTVEALSKVQADSVELINKLSKQPSVEPVKKTIDNKFNKTKTKSRAQQILTS